jgi:hypothetical protein
MNLEAFKEFYVRQIKVLYSDRIIYKEYPLHKQLNAGSLRVGYKEQDKQDMDVFITSKVDDIRALEADVIGLNTDDIIKNFPKETRSEEERMEYPSKYLKNCDTDEKKLVCWLALQDVLTLY